MKQKHSDWIDFTKTAHAAPDALVFRTVDLRAASDGREFVMLTQPQACLLVMSAFMPLGTSFKEVETTLFEFDWKHRFRLRNTDITLMVIPLIMMQNKTYEEVLQQQAQPAGKRWRRKVHA